MNILKRMLAPFQKGALVDTTRPLSIVREDDWPINRGYAGESAEVGSVLALSAAWACVNLIAGTIGTLPLLVYRTDRDGGRTVARTHPLYRVLHDSPNSDQTAIDFLEFIGASIELWGNSYARKDKVGNRVVGLTPIRPDIVSVTRERSGDLRYRWSEDGRNYDLTQRDVLHIRGFGGGPEGGLSTLQYGRNTFSLAKAIDRASGTTFANGLRPSGVLTFKEFIGQEKRDLVEKVLQEKFAGAMNSGRPMVLEGGSDWKSLTINPEDAQMLESRGFSVEEICRFFGVPPHMVGHTENSTSWGTGLEQQTLGFQKFTLRRRLKRIEQALEKQLLTPEDRSGGITIEFSLEGLLRGDSAARASFYQSGLNNGWMTINEVRALENLPPVEGGNVPRMQMQNVPITEAGNEVNQ